MSPRPALAAALLLPLATALAPAPPVRALARFPIVVPEGARAAFDSGSFSQVRDGGLHHAVDISVMRGDRALEGPEVVAPVAGRVLRRWAYGRRTLPGVSSVVPSERGGWYVWLRGLDGRFYYLAHLLRPSPLRPGQDVRAGERVGFVGRSGNVQGRPHLHFAIRTARGVVDPYPELRAVAARAHEAPARVELAASPLARAPLPPRNGNRR